MNTMRILEEEMDFLKSENDKKTLALDLAKANLARVGPKDSSPDSSQESGQENELVEDLDDELDKMRIRNSLNYYRVNSLFNASNHSTRTTTIDFGPCHELHGTLVLRLKKIESKRRNHFRIKIRDRIQN